MIKSSPKTTAAVRLLVELLASRGPMEGKDVVAVIAGHGFAPSTVYMARKRANVTMQVYSDGVVRWTLAERNGS